MAKAHEDLEAARVLDGTSLRAAAAFHCQQAVEKSLKALLIHRGETFGKVHSLQYLFELCLGRGVDFGALRDAAEPLTQFAVDQRYPGAHQPPTDDQVHDFLSTAESVLDRVEGLLEESK